VRRSARFRDEGVAGLVGATSTRAVELVLVEVNCESVAVAKGENSKPCETSRYKVAACPNVEYVKIEDIPAEIVQRKKRH